MTEQENEMTMIEKLSEELGEKELKIMEQEKEIKKWKNRCLQEMKDELMNAIRGINRGRDYEFCDDGFDTSADHRLEWDKILKEMNDNDWNEDGGQCELYIEDDVISLRFSEDSDED